MITVNADTIHSNERIQIESQQELESAFYKYRQGSYGAFDFNHASPFPWLSVLINGTTAYVHYFPSDGHPGFHSVANAGEHPTGQTIHFLQSGGDEGSSFDIDRSMTVSIELAFSAAKQFLSKPSLPTCILWEEL
jgi:hypothetical protein